MIYTTLFTIAGTALPFSNGLVHTIIIVGMYTYLMLLYVGLVGSMVSPTIKEQILKTTPTKRINATLIFSILLTLITGMWLFHNEYKVLGILVVGSSALFAIVNNALYEQSIK